MNLTARLTHHDGGVLLLVLAGEIDIADEDGLRDLLTAGLSASDRGLVVDLSRVTFMSCTGVGALVRLAGDADRAAVALVLTAASAPVSRLLTVLDLDGAFTMAATPAEAVALARDAREDVRAAREAE